jgi:thymidylate kinase
LTANNFIALVGPTGAGKDTFLEMIRKVAPPERCAFLCDSNGSGAAAPYNRFTAKVTQLARDGVHTETTPRSQVIFFWGRLEPIIEIDVLPALHKGKWVFINGFGGTILANAMLHATSREDREALLDLHKSMIEQCVVGLGVPPPKYLWLRPSPEVAYERRKMSGNLPPEVTLDHIKRLNDEFEFYGTIPGQTVIPIDADQSPEKVFEEGMKHINPDWDWKLPTAA